jgi:hypothetical protein
LVSTVTTSTITTITTAGLAGSLALIGVIFLLTLLIQKEIASGTENKRMERLGKILSISIIPLVIAFIVLAITKISDVLN